VKATLWALSAASGLAASSVLAGFAPTFAQSRHQAATASTTIRYGYWGNAQELQAYKAVIALYQKAHPTVKVESEFDAPAAFLLKLPTLFRGNSAPDVLNVAESWIGPLDAAYHPFADLRSYLTADHIQQDSFVKGTWAPATLAGKVYAIPKIVYGDAVAYNQDLFRKYHLPFPTAGWTTKDFVRDAIALTHGSGANKIWGVALPPVSYNVAQLYGGQLFDYKAGKMLATDPRVERAVQFQMDLMLKYKVMPAAIVTPNTISPFLTGKAAMDQTWVSYDQDSWATQIGSRFKWGVAPFPADWHGVLQANYTAISQSSTNKAAAWQFAKWLTTDPAALKILGQFSSLAYRPALNDWLAHPPAAWANVDRAATIAALPRSPFDYDGGVYTQIWNRFTTTLQQMQGGQSVNQTMQGFQQEGQQLIDRARG